MVVIIPYQESWPFEFNEIARALRRGLGGLALRIDHIGSTAIPGLPAKDVIDVQIAVAALDEQVISAMIALGYTLPEGVWRDHRPPDAEGPETDWAKSYFYPSKRGTDHDQSGQPHRYRRVLGIQ